MSVVERNGGRVSLFGDGLRPTLGGWLGFRALRVDLVANDWEHGLRLGEPDMSAEMLEVAMCLSTVKDLRLRADCFGDLACREIVNCHRIETLYVESPNVTDVGLNVISQMKNLRRLSLRGTSISSKGFQNISELARLEAIDLSECRNVDKDALKYLAKIPNLRRVAVWNSGIGQVAVLDMGWSVWFEDSVILHGSPKLDEQDLQE